jgi:hypothetical protein
MKIIFGFVGLLVVLAIIGHLSKTQLSVFGLTGTAKTRAVHQGSEAQAVTDAVMGRAGGTGGAATVAVPGGVAGATPAVVEGTVPMQAKAIQDNVRNQTSDALQRGADRAVKLVP